MTEAEKYLEQFRQANSLQERQQVALDYKLFYSQLAVGDQKQADQVMSIVWPAIQQKVDELDTLMAQAEQFLQGEFAYQK